MKEAATRHLVPASEVEAELIVKNSRFVAYLARASTPEEAQHVLNHARRTWPGANHYCWARVLGAPGLQEGASDDGEPHGTAGRPMLNVLRHKKIGQVCAVVTRYFGGVKLGRGGLVKAYTQSLQEALGLATWVEHLPRQGAEIVVPYRSLEPLRAMLHNHEAQITEETFTDSVRIACQIPIDRAHELNQHLENFDVKSYRYL